MYSTSSTKVFDVPELLEHIILSLPEYDILTSAQRVSRAWKASVDASPGIQRKLLCRRGDERVASPIRFVKNKPGEDWVEEMPIYQRTVKFNPLLEAARSLYPGCSMEVLLDRHGLWEPPNQWHLRNDIDVGYDADGNPAFSDRSDRSWRNMQVCDPPISVVLLQSQVMPHIPSVPFYPMEHRIFSAVLDRDGITMGLVFDTVAALLRNYSDSRFWCFRMSFGIDTDYDELWDESDDSPHDSDGDGEGSDGESRRERDGGEETGWGFSSDEDSDNESGDGSGDDKSGEDAPASSMESAMSTMSKVLAIPELLQDILSFLPEREIITSVQRVSRTWRSSVVDSLRIQRKLFLSKGNKSAAVRPVRLSHFGDDGLEDEEFGIPIYKQSVAINSLLNGRNLYPKCGMNDVGYTCKSQAVPAGDFDKIHVMLMQAHPGGSFAFSHDHLSLSWRSMQLCDPPITVANLEVYSDAEVMGPSFSLSSFDSTPDINATLFDRDGTTMGLAYDTGVAMLGWKIGKEDPKNALWFTVISGIHHTLENSQSATKTK
jgi:hypothetical protein